METQEKLDKLKDLIKIYGEGASSKDNVTQAKTWATGIVVSLFTTAIIAITNLLMGSKTPGVGGLSDSMYLYLCMALFAFILFFLIYAYFTRASKYKDGKDLFAAVVNAYIEGHSEYIAQLKCRMDESQTMLAAMRAKYEPFLVSWEKSAEMEKAAKKVRCLTPNLTWILKEQSGHLKIDELIWDVIENESNTYHYLCFRSQVNEYTTQLLDNLNGVRNFFDDKRLAERYKSEAQSRKISNIASYIKERIKIKVLFVPSGVGIFGDGENGSDHILAIDLLELKSIPTHAQWKKHGFNLPVPGDLVIYSDVDMTKTLGSEFHGTEVLVMSRYPVVTTLANKEKIDEKFDVLLTDLRQIVATGEWFNDNWS